MDNKIYVVIPVYNAEKYIAKTIQSVLTQNRSGTRIVLVDDGSSDNSRGICEEYAQKYNEIEYFYKENGGVSSARNAGIEYILAHNEDGYIAFLDADDIWCDNAFTGWGGIRQNADIVLWGMVAANEFLTRYSAPTVYEKEEIIDGGRGAIWKPQGHFAAALYSTELLRKYGVRFDEKLKYSEDKIFRLQCVYLAEKVQLVNRVLYIYRQNSSSAMSKVKDFSAIDYYDSIIRGWVRSDAFLKSVKDNGEDAMNAGRALAGIYFLDMAVAHVKHGGKLSSFFTYLDNHPDKECFYQMRECDVSPKQFKEKNLLTNNKKVFALKYRILGCAEMLAKALVSIRCILNRFERRRYPYENCNYNNK